jgi:hypothetical protein
MISAPARAQARAKFLQGQRAAPVIRQSSFHPESWSSYSNFIILIKTDVTYRFYNILDLHFW